MAADVGSLLAAAEIALDQAGVETPRLDAKMLLAYVLDCSPHSLGLKRADDVTENQTRRFHDVVEQRRQRRPVSQIVGQRGFWTLDLIVTSDTLDPRPDSETLIEAVLEHRPDKTQPFDVLDFGTGTGCLLLAVLAEYPLATGLGVDLSAKALAVAQANAEACHLTERVQFVQSRWGQALGAGRFQVILSNPPYIPQGDIAGLQPEVARWEPHLALSGGVDGLDCYREVLPHIARLLDSGGLAVLEVGQGQAQDVADLGTYSGLKPLGTRRDLGGIERCVILTTAF